MMGQNSLKYLLLLYLALPYVVIGIILQTKIIIRWSKFSNGKFGFLIFSGDPQNTNINT